MQSFANRINNIDKSKVNCIKYNTVNFNPRINNQQNHLVDTEIVNFSKQC